MNLSEQWLYRVLIVGLLLSGFFYFGNKYLNKIYDNISEYKIALMADRFAKSVSHVHQQWSVQLKSRDVKIEYFKEVKSDSSEKSKIDSHHSTNIWVKVNKKGWPIAVGKQATGLNCRQLWEYFSEVKDDQEQIKTEVSTTGTICNFRWQLTKNETKTFRYDSKVGKITTETVKSEIIADKGN